MAKIQKRIFPKSISTFIEKNRIKQVTQGKPKDYFIFKELSTTAGSFLKKKNIPKIWQFLRPFFIKTQGIAICAGTICITDFVSFG